MIDYTTIEDYKVVSCGCCTGKTVKASNEGRYRLAEDQCVCWMHQDAPRGSPARKCSRHSNGSKT